MEDIVAMFCYHAKQHIADADQETDEMRKMSSSEVLAGNLRAWMAARDLKQTDLAQKSGVAQTTISLYLRPAARKDTHGSKDPSPKLSHVEALADALGVDAWELLRPQTSERIELLARLEQAIALFAPQASAAAPDSAGNRRAA